MDNTTAANAYAAAARRAADLTAGGTGVVAPPAVPRDAFTGMVEQVLDKTGDAMAAAETANINAVAGEGSLLDVVTAVSNAESVVETVVAVRDRMMRAYEEIIRMPI